MTNKLIVALSVGICAAIIMTGLSTPSRPTAPGQFWVTNTVDGIQDQLRTVECPSNMPECGKTARERYRKWKRGGYGFRRPWRIHYGKSIKRAILRKAANIFHRKYPDREWHRRKQWANYRNGTWYSGGYRVCITNSSFWYFGNSNPGDYCEQQWYKNPRRRFVKNVFVCAGQIALAAVGSRRAPRSDRRTLIGGTGALCGWDKMP